MKRGRESEEESTETVVPNLAAAAQSRTNPITGKAYSARYYELLKSRERLPIFAKKSEIKACVAANPVTLLVGETGSGKTTQVPHFLAEMRDVFRGLVACTQPRRIAAISVASRVAEEMDVCADASDDKGVVGYHVRFQSTYSLDRTKVLFLTDGMLLREMASEADLLRYSVVIVDEAHERTVSTDIALGLLKQLVERRPTFRLVVMSATLDVEKLRAYFPAAPLLQVSGRTFPVSVEYSPAAVRDYVSACVDRACAIHLTEGRAGDVLCFLTGEAEIERAVAETRRALAAGAVPSGGGAAGVPTRAVVLPLYGSLPLEEQQKVFHRYPPDTRKIVFATNIAETSVTIDGVVFVVDCGYQKQSLYSAEARVDYLLPALISKASAEQRRGRAGRTQAGTCYRLVTQEEFERYFPPQTHPEILRTKITNPLLLMLKLGVQNPMTFPFVDPPARESLTDAFFQLLYYGAVDGELRLTELGRQMADLPVDVALARMLIRSAEYRCAADATVVAAMLEAGEVFASAPGQEGARARFQKYDGDHFALVFAFHAFYKHQASGAHFCRENALRFPAMQRALQIYAQLRSLLSALKLPVQSTYDEARQEVDATALRRAILEGFFLQTAYLPPGKSQYVTVRDAQRIVPHRRSMLGTPGRGSRPTWIVYDRLEVQRSTEEDAFFRVATPVEISWLLEVSEFFRSAGEISDPDIALALMKEMERTATPS